MHTFILTAVFLMAAAIGLACQKASSSSVQSSGSGDQSSTNVPVRAKETRPEPAVAPAESVVSSLTTPSEAYKTAYDLRKKKDVSGLKQVMTKDILEFMTMMGESEKKSLDDVLKEICEKPQADRAESRNEKIKGNIAQVEYLTETGSWKTMDFEKVEGKWFLSLPSSEKLNGPEADK
ncbi:MAG: hypothetical protein ACJ72Z_10140 [Pyrinomonadaceae bacterium]